jgi:hypothetical protein
MRVTSVIALYIENSSICVVPCGVDLHQTGFCSFDRKQYSVSLSWHMRVNFLNIIEGPLTMLLVLSISKRITWQSFFLSPCGYRRSVFCNNIGARIQSRLLISRQWHDQGEYFEFYRGDCYFYAVWFIKKIKLYILSVTSCSRAVWSVIDWGTRVRMFPCYTVSCESYVYYCYILEQASSMWECLHLSLWTYFLTSCNFGVSLPIPLSSDLMCGWPCIVIQCG